MHAISSPQIVRRDEVLPSAFSLFSTLGRSLVVDVRAQLWPSIASRRFRTRSEERAFDWREARIPPSAMIGGDRISARS